MTWEETKIELARNHIYADPLHSDSGSVVGLKVSANPYVKEDRMFCISNALDRSKFKVIWDKKIEKIVITKK